MFTFLRKKTRQPTTILIDGLSITVSDQIAVDTVWQQRHMISSVGDILSKAINATADPIDTALTGYIDSHTLAIPAYKPFHVIAFNPHEGVSGNVWHHGEYYLPAIKGIPEHILDHCDMSDNERESIMAQLHSMSDSGNTVIAVATGLLQRPIKDLRDLKNNEKLSFVGLVSLRMTASAEAKRLLANPSAKIYLATGQHPSAANTVASQLGLITNLSDVFDARRLDVMNAGETQSAVATARVFARATPERKDLIFDTLRAADESTVRITTLIDLQKLLAK